MSTRFTHTMTYDASLADISAMLDDATYREDVVTAQGGSDGSVRFEQIGDTVVVVISQLQPSESIPGFARKFVGDEINLLQREAWTTAEHADLEVTIPGKPGQMVGSIELTHEGGTTTETIDVEIAVRIPLVGGKIEKLIADLLRKALRAEEQVGRDYLSG